MASLILAPALSTEWFIREGPDLSNADFVQKGREISVSENSIEFRGNSRGLLLRSAPVNSSERNETLSIVFSGESLSVGISQFSLESGETSSENFIRVLPGSLAEVFLEGPEATLNESGAGFRTLSVTGISFPEEGPYVISLSCTDCNITSISGAASFGGKFHSRFPRKPPFSWPGEFS
ncbi:MAG: hypothetical protein V1820_04695 [archaeon]